MAVCVAISLMLQNKYFDGIILKTYNIKSIKMEAQRRAVAYLEQDESTEYVSKMNVTGVQFPQQ